MYSFSKKLGDLKAKDRYRTLGKPRGIDLTSNDYLGFKNHPALRRAAMEALESGIEIGSGGSRLLRGQTQAHEALEVFAAGFFSCERALYFSTGFQANTAIFTTLSGRHDTIIFDSLIHASAREGIQASKAKHIRVNHNDLDSYEDALERARGQGGTIFIAVESLYSMEGDFAKLAEIYALAQAYDAILIVDEAHATGVWGQGGRGLAYGLWQGSFQMQPADIVTLHTCGKALGVAGGLICASAEIVEILVNLARSFIYSTAPLPLQAVLVQEALSLAGSAEGDCLRQKLYKNCALMGNLLAQVGVDLQEKDKAVQATQIIPIILGEDSRAVYLAEEMQGAGFDIRAIRPPTVPEGTARLRLSLSAELEGSILRNFSDILRKGLKKAQ